MGALLDAQLGPRGVHTEDSPDYHFFATTLIGRILDAPWWRIADMDPFRAKLAAAQDARYWLVDPAGRCLPVGDSTEKVRVKKFDGLRRWPHTGRRGAVLGAAVDGYAVVRTDPAVPVDRSAILFLTASFHLETHKHADCLSVIWQEAGENLLIDSGKYGYQQDRMQDYFQSSRAHNTLEIDGRSFSRKTAHAYGSGIKRVEALERTWIVEAEADHASKGVRHRRCVFFWPHHFMLAVDHVTAVRSASRLTRLRQAVRRRRIFASWWHFNPAHTVAAARSGRSLCRLGPGQGAAAPGFACQHRVGAACRAAPGRNAAACSRLGVARLSAIRAGPGTRFFIPRRVGLLCRRSL